ncbi:MAG: hypothetical protein K0S54_1638 [Alphaproteobacteria bacterium]|jgi:hypothetical protein|nr:hypothetical protein [Alphaproteobacteria bacterium]
MAARKALPDSLRVSSQPVALRWGLLYENPEWILAL